MASFTTKTSVMNMRETMRSWEATCDPTAHDILDGNKAKGLLLQEGYSSSIFRERVVQPIRIKF